MVKSLLKVRRFGFGGYYDYFISDDEKYFFKICKGESKLVKEEFLNLSMYWNKLNVKNLQLVEPVKYLEEKDLIITKYIKAKTLEQNLKPDIYFLLGQKLKLFHNKGFNHGHLEINDIMFKNGEFFFTDVPFFNKHTPNHDIATLILSIKMFRIKKIISWKSFNKCEKAFLAGYKINATTFEKQYDTVLQQRINFLLNRKDFISKTKSILFKFARILNLL